HRLFIFSLCLIYFLLTLLTRRPPLFPYTTLFRSDRRGAPSARGRPHPRQARGGRAVLTPRAPSEVQRVVSLHLARGPRGQDRTRSEEHTSELQSRFDLVCRLLLEIKKKQSLHISP